MSPEFNGGWVVLVKYDEIHAQNCGSSLSFPQKSEKIGISSFCMSNWNQNDSIDYGYQTTEPWLQCLTSSQDRWANETWHSENKKKTVCKTWSPFIPSLGSSKRHDHIASIYWYVFFSLCLTSYTATFDSMIVEQWRGQIRSIELEHVRWCVRENVPWFEFFWDSLKEEFHSQNCSAIYLNQWYWVELFGMGDDIFLLQTREDQPLSQQSANGIRCITQDVLELSAIDAWLQNLRSHTHTPHTTDIILGKEVCNEINETFEYIWYIWINIYSICLFEVYKKCLYNWKNLGFVSLSLHVVHKMICAYDFDCLFSLFFFLVFFFVSPPPQKMWINRFTIDISRSEHRGLTSSRTPCVWVVWAMMLSLQPLAWAIWCRSLARSIATGRKAETTMYTPLED